MGRVSRALVPAVVLTVVASVGPATSPVEVVRIGYFGPSDPGDTRYGDVWRAVSLAIEQANEQGTTNGRPFHLVTGWSRDPWGTGVRDVVRMVYADRVWAVLGGPDGPSTHLAEQVVAKARVPLISPTCFDKTVHYANVPWMFSCVPGDEVQALPLADAVASNLGDGPLVMVSGTDHDSHLFAAELVRCLRARRVTPGYHFEFDLADGSLDELVREALATRPKAVAIVAEAQPSGRFVLAARRAGFDGDLFGGPCAGQRLFRITAGAAGEGVVFPLLYSPNPDDPFVQRFTRRFGREPDYLAAHGYDAARLLVDAITKAGLDRDLIRDAVRDLSGFCGVTGTIRWDKWGGNVRPVHLGVIREGRVLRLDAPSH